MTVRRSPSSLLAVWSATCAAIIGGAPAQEKQPPASAPAQPPAAAAPVPDEADALAQGGKELGAFAALCSKNGFPARAKTAWLEVLAEYAPDDEDARKALGFVKVGTAWQRDPKFQYPVQDQPNAGVARMLEQRWQALVGKLGELHRATSTMLAGKGNADRAAWHTQRALRFQPNDGKALAQAGKKQIEGITVDDIDAAVLQRSRRMERAIAKLTTQATQAAPADEKLPMLDKAGVPYTAVKSQRFVVYGDWDVDVMVASATWAERALQFCEEAFDGVEGYPTRGKQSRQYVFLKSKETWADIVRKNATGGDADFVVQNASATQIGDVHVASPASIEVVNDLSVRWVVQDYTAFGRDALREGIGHAVVGMFFGRNLTFSVGQLKQEGTVAGPRDQAKLLLPDMETWKELAVEAAFRKDGTRAARLPLLKAAKFPSDARIMAWSFCDYLLRRDPALLRTLERAAGGAMTDEDVLNKFLEYAGQPLQHVEDRWRRLWTEDSPLRRAVIDKTTPLEAASKEAPEWLDAFNKLRKALKLEPVGWSAQLSVACKDHADYLKANKDQRGPEKEHTELAGKPGYTNAGRTFAALAMVWTKDAKSAADTWLLLPGYRDAVINTNIDTVGIYAEGGIVVLDPTRGTIGGDKQQVRVWPLPGTNATVPSAVDVDLLGPEAQRVFADNKRGKQKQIGYPLSLHLYASQPGEVSCKVTCQGEAVSGFLVPAQGTIRRTSAPGMWVFYPAEPLKRGVEITAQWKWSDRSESVKFTAN